MVLTNNSCKHKYPEEIGAESAHVSEMVIFYQKWIDKQRSRNVDQHKIKLRLNL